MNCFEDYIPFQGFEIIDDAAKISESYQSEVAASKGAILAIVKGPHFVPGGISRNHRLYTKELWKSVAEDEEFMDRLNKCQVIGRIGHEAEMTDMDVADGNFSHYTRNIDFDTGIAETVIMNTPMGNTLLTLLRSGVTMYVSSRAEGDYDGQDEEGNDILDLKTFRLERFDFVQDPGFLDAHPKMVTESRKKENSKEEVVESLLGLAKEVGCPLSLDMHSYTVKDISEGRIVIESDVGVEETLAPTDFTEVLEEISASIKGAFAGIKEELESLKEDVKVLRYANQNGLNENYVRSQIAEGMDLRAIKPPAPEPRRYSIVVNESKNSEENSTFLSRFFG